MVRSLAVACGDREAAEDAVQDAFTRAYARWRSISRYDYPAGWIRHVAINRLRDHFRREKRGARVVDRLAALGVTADLEPKEPDTDFVGALARLPPRQRIAMSLFYGEDLSVREIAASMRISEGAVKFHLHTGRAALREWIGAR